MAALPFYYCSVLCFSIIEDSDSESSSGGSHYREAGGGGLAYTTLPRQRQTDNKVGTIVSKVFGQHSCL